MTTFLVIRHGYSKSNENGYFTGQTDVPLAELGLQQAEQTAKYLSSHYQIDFLYSSPLQRAYQTAIPLSKYANLPIQIEENLKEINGGDWEEKTPEQILQLYNEEYTLWLNDIGVARCTNGETMQEVQLRAAKVLERIAKRHDGKTVAVATHAGVIRALQCLWQNLSLEEMKNIPWVENASFCVVTYDNGTFTPLKIGCNEHLTTPKTNLPKNM